MGFKEAIRTCLFSKYATFQGRASRSEYWYFWLFLVLAAFLLIFLTGVLGGLALAMAGNPDLGQSTIATLLPLVLILPFGLLILIPTIAVGVRRLHDRDMSGWWYLGLWLLTYVPFIGFAVSIGWLVLNCLKGSDGPNRFGSDPLRPNHTADIFA